MASQKTLDLKRDRTLARFLNVRVIEQPINHPNHQERRKALQKQCKQLGIKYAEARQVIRKEEDKMRAQGKDPFDPASYEQPKNDNEGKDDAHIETSRIERDGGEPETEVRDSSQA